MQWPRAGTRRRGAPNPPASHAGRAAPPARAGSPPWPKEPWGSAGATSFCTSRPPGAKWPPARTRSSSSHRHCRNRYRCRAVRAASTVHRGSPTPRMVPTPEAQLLEPAVEYHMAAYTEHVVARFDDFAHPARGHEVAGLRQLSRCSVRGASEGIQRQPAQSRQKLRIVGVRLVALGFARGAARPSWCAACQFTRLDPRRKGSSRSWHYVARDEGTAHPTACRDTAASASRLLRMPFRAAPCA